MQVDTRKNICVISGESIAVEAAIMASEGTVVAVEYSARDRRTLEDNVSQFGLNNVTIIDHVDEQTMADLPVPDVTMLVASASMEQEMNCLLKLNPKMEFVIYTLDFAVAAAMSEKCKALGVGDVEVIQVTVSKLKAVRIPLTPSPPRGSSPPDQNKKRTKRRFSLETGAFLCWPFDCVRGMINSIRS